MKRTSIFSLALLLVGFLMSTVAWGQQDKSQRASPPDSASGKIGDAMIKINYSSPSVKGRTIWGELVPYGEVWRSGANEATTVEVDQDVMVEGRELPAGRYSFYTIPGEDEWTVIFNKVADQWGTAYDEGQDVLRVTATPRQSANMNERLIYDVTDDGIVLLWENVELPISVKDKE
ncbi:MAG: DUF2911 domain-containing protein [Hymenobacteraceae bacterium]|nr:DUF2911 domain-containing protein [Hymenobacteraceae bacterium]